jgi:hypothetical protein
MVGDVTQSRPTQESRWKALMRLPCVVNGNRILTGCRPWVRGPRADQYSVAADTCSRRPARAL